MRLQPLEGQFFGRLLCLTRCENIGPHVAYMCLCKCGKQVNVRGHSLRNGDTTSCGCARADKMRSEKTTHGKYGTPTYLSYRAMLARCMDKTHKQYKDYGGRGIKVCDRWNIFENFYADMGERPGGTTLDRRDSNGNYEKSNCKWSTRTEQNRNKRKSTHGESYAQ